MTKGKLILFFLFTGLTVFSQTEEFYSTDTSKYKSYRDRIKDQTFFINLDPNNTRAYTTRANYEFVIRDWKACIEDFSKVIESDPDFVYAYYKRAACKDRIKDYEGAIKDLTKALSMKSYTGGTDIPKELIHYDRGIIFNRLKKFKDAEKDFHGALELKPNWADAFWGLGLINDDQGNYEAAINFYNKSILADSTNFKSFNNIGSIYIKQKKYDLAINYFEKSLKIFPKYSNSLVNLADAKHLKGDKEGACEAFQKYILAGFPYTDEKNKKYCGSDK